MERLRAANENTPLQVGDWVSVVAENVLSMLEENLGRPPYVVARIEGEVAHIVARKDYKVGMNVPLTAREGRATFSSWGISSKDLKIELKPTIVKK